MIVLLTAKRLAMSTTEEPNMQYYYAFHNVTYDNTDTDVQDNVGTDQKTLEARGNYSYSDNEGNTSETTSHIANEDEFGPHGGHTHPPQIEAALQFIAEQYEKRTRNKAVQKYNLFTVN